VGVNKEGKEKSGLGTGKKIPGMRASSWNPARRNSSAAGSGTFANIFRIRAPLPAQEAPEQAFRVRRRHTP